MSKINDIQQKILNNLEGGAFQKLVDAYLYKKFKFTNIQTLGVQAGTNKTTIGVPDSYVIHKDGTYTLIMYGTHQNQPLKKIKDDIASCFDQGKLNLEKDKIKKIICSYTSTNIKPEQIEEIRSSFSNVEIELLGISTISHDLHWHYPKLAHDHLGISVDTRQLLVIDDFVSENDSNEVNSPLKIKFQGRKTDLEKTVNSIKSNKITLISGQPGVGKTRLVVEVCKQFEDDYTILCLKNKQLSIYEDIQQQLSTNGNYLLFIDDINQMSSLKYILDHASTSSSKNISVKIIATVRDYAKQAVLDSLKNYFKPTAISDILIEILTDKEIEDILKSSFPNLNYEYVRRISEIAKGNTRLAILAGISATENGVTSINNATDIFANYYGKILDEQVLSKMELNVLFITSIMQRFHIEDSDFLLDLLTILEINQDELLEICHSLNEKELIDLHFEKAVVQNNQVLSDYILYYYFIDKKIVQIQRLLNVSFPKYSKKIVRALDTINRLFYSSELKKYIKEEVTQAWNMAEEDYDKDYLECFHAFNMDKSLGKIYEHIDKLEVKQTNISETEFIKIKQKAKIEDYWVSTLSNHKGSKHSDNVINLLFNLLYKRSDLIAEIYLALKKYLIDYLSYKDDYKTEYNLLEIIQSQLAKNNDTNLKMITTHLISELLDYDIRTVDFSSDSNAIRTTHFSVVFTSGFKKMRKLALKIIADFYHEGLFQETIHNILISYKGGMTSEKSKLIFEYDLECIKELFLSKWVPLSFTQSFVIYELGNFATQVEVDFPRYEVNSDFSFFLAIIEEDMSLEWKERENQRLLHIKENVSNWELSDFERLFKIISSKENQTVMNNWKVNPRVTQGMNQVFNVIRDDEKCINIIYKYFENNAPYSHYINIYLPVLKILVDKLSFAEVVKKIQKYQLEFEDVWLSNLFGEFSGEQITKLHIEKLLDFIKSGSWNNKPITVNVIALMEYFKIDKEIAIKVGHEVLKANSEYPRRAYEFLDRADIVNETDEIIKMFSDNMTILKELYLIVALNSHRHFDFQGKLLFRLVCNDLDFWKKYVSEMVGKMSTYNVSSTIFTDIWLLEDYQEFINIAYDTIFNDPLGFLKYHWFELIFVKNNQESEMISARKENWLTLFIQKNIDDVEQIKRLFGLINNSMDNSRLKYFLTLLNSSRDIALLKEIPLCASQKGWSGSQLSVIDYDIRFLEDLKDNLKEIDYLPHCSYLNDYIDKLEKSKSDVKIREALFEW